MTVERRLQICMALLVVLGTLLLGLGQPTPTMPLLAIFAVVTSLLFTDVWRWFRLHRVVANVAAVGAAVFSLWSFFRDNSQEQLLSIANLLNILLVILLYQEKNVRLYWQLAMLSLLQVVVAAALSLGPLFGLLLVAYMLTAIAALTLFFLHRETLRLAEVESAATVGPAAGAKVGLSRPTHALWRATPPKTFQPLDHDALERSFGGTGLLWQFAPLGLVTFVFALTLFYSIPRTGASAWQGPAPAGQRYSGFSQQVSLDQMGEILQNHETVMRVSFFDSERRQPYLVEAPYFRGAVLTDYHFDGYAAQWDQSSAVAAPRSGRRLRRAAPPPNLVRQEVTLSSSGISSESGGDPPPLFSVYPLYPLADTPESLRFDGRTEKLFRLSNDPSPPTGQYSYVLGTSAFRSAAQSPLTPHDGDRLPPVGAIRDRLLHGGKDSKFNRLRETARQVLRPGGRKIEGRREQALALEGHFLDPEPLTLGAPDARPYTYSLRPADAQRDRNLDPIEDFVANHRSGHCEYFASALAIMLRTQGIPARLVVGYKGGEYNSLGDYWQVRQLHAHAWVEAYLEPEDVPEGGLAEGESAAGGAWLRLDPTPAADLPAAAGEETSLFGFVYDAFDYAQLLWTDYVVGLNSETQKKALFPGVEGESPVSLADLVSAESWRPLLRELARAVGLDLRNWPAGHWFSWRAGLTAIVFCLAAVGFVRGAAWLYRRAFRRRRRWTEDVRASSRPKVAFYERLLAILARRGMERRPEQTPREFAAEVARWLAPVNSDMASSGDPPALLPARVVESFYLVRFGAATLDKSEADQIEQALTKLDQSLHYTRS